MATVHSTAHVNSGSFPPNTVTWHNQVARPHIKKHSVGKKTQQSDRTTRLSAIQPQRPHKLVLAVLHSISVPSSPLPHRNHSVRKMRCTPLCVSTIPLISPTRNPNAASSNGFCICPGPNRPRSPSCSCEKQSECLRASAPNVSALVPTSDWYPPRIAIASSLERVMFACLYLIFYIKN